MKDRRKRDKRIKLRSSVRAILIIIALVSFAFSSNNIFQELKNKGEEKSKKEIYKYTNNYKASYVINVKDNRFIEEETLPMNQTYVTELIKSMDLDINYEYKSSKETNVKYSYEIVANIGASYTENGKEYNVLNKKYILLKEKSGESQGNFKIHENVNVDLPKYNKEINDFKQTMGMALDAYLNIQLNVKTTTNIGGKNVDSDYSSDFKLTLGSKITIIDAKDNDVKVGHLEEENIVESKANIFIVIINTVVLIISIYGIYYIATKTKAIHNIKNEYKLELNRILKSCQDKIIMITKKMDVDEANVIEVKDFGELIKLSEELYKPILYWNSDDEQEAWFCVISNTVTYRFILRKW